MSDGKIAQINDIPDGLLARLLAAVSEYRRRHEGALHVVKASGKIVDNPDIRRSFAAQVVAMRRDLGLNVVVVHGAGKQIDKALADAGLQSVKKDGMRITNAAHVEIIDRTANEANHLLCEAFREVSGEFICPVGLPGYREGLNLFSAPEDPANDNYSGIEVRAERSGLLLSILEDRKSIPIITNMCGVEQAVGGIAKINANADTIASALAINLNAHRLIMCSDVAGVLDENGQVIHEIREDEVGPLVLRGVLRDGMLIKVKEAFATASRMAPGGGVVIMDENFLVELLTHKGHGTLFRAPAP